MLQREHSAILLTFIKIFVLSTFERPFCTGFTVFLAKTRRNIAEDFSSLLYIAQPHFIPDCFVVGYIIISFGYNKPCCIGMAASFFSMFWLKLKVF